MNEEEILDLDELQEIEEELLEEDLGHRPECTCDNDPAWCELHGGWR